MVLLSFNIDIPTENQKKSGQELVVSMIENYCDVLTLKLDSYGLSATFFVEISLAVPLKKLLKSLSLAGYEIGLLNTNSDAQTILKTKNELEEYLDKAIRGLRQKNDLLPYPVIHDLGITYVSNIEDSNLNFLWRKFTEKTEIYTENNLTIVPESQSPYSQLPYNDYVLQTIPMKYYENMLLESLKSMDYILVYANIWQLFQKKDLPFSLPFYKKINLGKHFEDRLESLFQFLNEHEIAVSRMKDYLF